jgi:hypothetical protein
MRRDLAYLEDIVEASDAISEFIRDHNIRPPDLGEVKMTRV